MSLGLVGKKQGMTRLFTNDGQAIAVTVVSVKPNIITQIKKEEKAQGNIYYGHKMTYKSQRLPYGTGGLSDINLNRHSQSTQKFIVATSRGAPLVAAFFVLIQHLYGASGGLGEKF